MKYRRFALALTAVALWAGPGRAQEPPLLPGPELAPAAASQPELIIPPRPVPPAASAVPVTTVPDFIPIGPYPPPAGAFPPIPTALSKGVQYYQPAVAVQPPTHVGHTPYIPPQFMPGREAFGTRPIRNTLNWLGLGCWAHHNNVTCSSLRSELTFIFGSCRAWHGEPCAHGPPPVPMPAGTNGPGGPHGPHGPDGH